MPALSEVRVCTAFGFVPLSPPEPKPPVRMSSTGAGFWRTPVPLLHSHSHVVSGALPEEYCALFLIASFAFSLLNFHGLHGCVQGVREGVCGSGWSRGQMIPQAVGVIGQASFCFLLSVFVLLKSRVASRSTSRCPALTGSYERAGSCP